MDPALKTKILSLLEEHRILSLATLRPDGWPQATTVGYVNEGLTLYFICGRESQKAHNLALDNRVSFTIDHDVPDPLAIRGLSAAGRAYPVAGEAEIRHKVLELLPKKYPEYAGMMQGVDFSTLAVMRVEMEVVSILDYRLGFGHADLVAIAPAERAAA